MKTIRNNTNSINVVLNGLTKRTGVKQNISKTETFNKARKNRKKDDKKSKIRLSGKLHHREGNYANEGKINR